MSVERYGSIRNFCREFIASSFLLVALSAAGIPASADAAGMADVLLFAGDGTSRNDVASKETISQGQSHQLLAGKLFPIE